MLHSEITVYHEPVGKDVIRVTLKLPDVCPVCGAKITGERQKIEIRNFPPLPVF